MNCDELVISESIRAQRSPPAVVVPCYGHQSDQVAMHRHKHAWYTYSSMATVNLKKVAQVEQIEVAVRGSPPGSFGGPPRPDHVCTGARLDSL